MLYRYETHCHCNLASRCAHSSPAELVYAHHAAGYAGLILTDHFIHGNTAVPTELPWEDQMRRYYDAFLEAKAAAAPLDFDVIFGIEHAYGGGLEVLCYGIDLNFLLENPDIPQLNIRQFADRVHAYGGILIHAHPYRWAGPELKLPYDCLDGIEIYNAGNPPEKNLLALQNLCSLIPLAGGDIHKADESRVATSGIALPYRIQKERELIQALQNRDHSLIINGRVLASPVEADLMD